MLLSERAALLADEPATYADYETYLAWEWEQSAALTWADIVRIFPTIHHQAKKGSI